MKKILILAAAALTSTQGVAEDDLVKYTMALQKIASPATKVVAVSDTPIKGVKEILVDVGRGSEVMYISEDGKYLVNGSLFDIENRVDLTDAKKTQMRKDVMKAFGKGDTIDFFPEEGKMTSHVTVFTDIDCGYCRKLHADMQGYNDLGIGVSYLFFPRAGLNSASFDKAVNVWCANDKQEAMTLSKAGEPVEPKTCDNPIAAQYKAGVTAGVSGTPAIVLDDGTLMPGYLPPAQLKQRMDMLAMKK
ncbi:thioredoxin fold domain-containing protein [Marinicella rhabdoformis]|uniref:thioredoxin fold domain-containing protein n=1 Tax=Marinicella rhabdoformis TaxID=2580566 RepID=UPI0012AECB22|nr:thioredoxin fold domain-containing protein [Marinicella rhabdoformis]